MVLVAYWQEHGVHCISADVEDASTSAPIIMPDTRLFISFIIVHLDSIANSS
jgi:hypothetical protein